MIHIGILPNAEHHTLWPGIYALLEMAARRGDCPVFSPGHVVWIASDGPLIIAAATTRMTLDGEAELMNVGGVRAKEWVAAWESMICDWARFNGAKKIISGGEDGSRLGWWRWGRRLGWKKADDRHVYEKAL